ncbi:MAG: 4-hydroxy-tetrahydrodipicolinate synthase [Thermoanaerobacteraceae bacterium]|uniref:4-hydroxy-tetrahydrodipicolinate synthase n=1 Tax=Thermanaeromonas sp. C210 TaxID=2731925 RepID=UPI00155BB4C8|nr:4-hydroxy-tetrahydrodipicolinate synthase [Thermanaeromonas sp. C210]MBE3581611.1 4-hydroxy-tetrahydrodipicolinate synthase [Thermoanaerobacteraceae bacterium]GFN23822.1 4-hydroxy-tetrahydrodipicolinate synthase [Thermanaeromonas sp. C210]
MVKWGRILTAMVTPFKQTGELDLEGARKLASHLVEHGSDGLVVAGTTGESPTLTHEEKIALFAAVKEAVGDRAVVIAGTGGNSTSASIELSREAEKVGVDGLMLVVPYYNRPSQEGLYRHFKAVAEATSLPIILYNIPSRTGRNMEADTTLKLAAIDNVVAVKESSGDLDQVTTILRNAPEGFLVYSGDDSLTLPLMSVGGYGIVSVAAHVVGERMQAMVRAYVQGNTAEAAAIHQELFPVFKALFVTTNPVPVKAALNMLGLPAGPVRLPLVEATAAEKEKITQALRSAGLLS